MSGSVIVASSGLRTLITRTPEQQRALSGVPQASCTCFSSSSFERRVRSADPVLLATRPESDRYIDLAANLGLGVVAEGVEDAETLAELTRLGCDAAQGYLISRPVPAGELAAWLADVSASSPPAWTARSRRLAVA
jgi:hypothetical protein